MLPLTAVGLNGKWFPSQYQNIWGFKIVFREGEEELVFTDVRLVKCPSHPAGGRQMWQVRVSEVVHNSRNLF